MRAARGKSFRPSILANQPFKSLVFVVVIAQAISYVSPMPQYRSNILFPTNPRADKLKNPSINNNGIVPIISPTNNNVKPLNNYNNGFQLSEFQIGSTGIACNRPGDFVSAPDGCNRCICADNGQLSTVCSRALCPPGFPSSVP